MSVTNSPIQPSAGWYADSPRFNTRRKPIRQTSPESQKQRRRCGLDRSIMSAPLMTLFVIIYHEIAPFPRSDSKPNICPSTRLTRTAYLESLLSRNYVTDRSRCQVASDPGHHRRSCYRLLSHVVVLARGTWVFCELNLLVSLGFGSCMRCRVPVRTSPRSPIRVGAPRWESHPRP